METSLTEKQLRILKESLRQRFAELRETVREELLRADQEQYGELAGQVNDLEEQSVADLLVDSNLAGIDRHIRQLRDIENALGRISQGSYGTCGDCGEPIAYSRLEANPTARRCRDCQDRYERTHAQPGQPKL